MKREMNKLVRDRIPEIIQESGAVPVFRTLTGKEYLCALDEKLMEEAREFLSDHSEEEMADLLEVIHAIIAANGLCEESIERIRKEKALPPRESIRGKGSAPHRRKPRLFGQRKKLAPPQGCKENRRQNERGFRSVFL